MTPMRTIVLGLALFARAHAFTARAQDSIGQELLPSKKMSPDEEKLEWRWSKEKANLPKALGQHLKDFDFYINNYPPFESFTVRRKSDGKLLYFNKRWERETANIARWKDTLFVAEYCPKTTGCRVVAVDLASGKTVWTTGLRGIELRAHFGYNNSVFIETDGKSVTIHGNESMGRYVERLDIKTGRMIANVKLEPDHDSWKR